MICIEETTDGRHYKFECPSCGEAGMMVLDPKDSGTFNCPAECGAVFIEYKSMVGWALRCVVQPVFEDASDEN